MPSESAEEKTPEAVEESATANGDVEKAPKPAEAEEDAAADSRAKLRADDVAFFTQDTTLNVLPTFGGKLLSSLTDGGFQYLLAGARASVGVKEGRYMFEVMIVESKDPAQPHANVSGPTPRQLVRIGFATSDSALLLPGDGVCFDSEGFFMQGKQRRKASQKFSNNQILAVVLNRDPKSANADTISLFCDGVRISEPQAVPEALKGKTLFPAVTYRNVTMQVHFGPQPLKPLPFKCRPLIDAAASDCEVTKAAVPKDGKYEVLFPVGIPDEGVYDWLDLFLGKNKNYVEISERMVLDWANKSGIQRTKGYGWMTTNDKPDMSTGLPLMDDRSVRQVIYVIAPAVKRNFVIMEVKGNLLEDTRKAALARFPSHLFRRACQVAMGEPSSDYLSFVHEQILAEKRAVAEAEADKKRKEQARKKAEAERKKKAEAAKKARELAAKKAKEAREAKAKKDAGEEDAPKEEAAKETEEEVKADEPEEAPEEEIVLAEVSLTDEDKNIQHRKSETPDISAAELSACFAKFTLPSKSEGFDTIEFAWQPEAKCKAHLRQWMTVKKATERVDHLQPSEWFQTKWNDWMKTLSAWKKRQQDFKNPAKKVKKDAPKPAAEEGEDGATDGKDEEEAKPEIDADDLDVFSVEDVTDIGNGEPLFAHFTWEDWALASLRFELHLLVHSFRHDLDDIDRQTFPEKHLAFYYNKYYKKTFSYKNFGVSDYAELAEFVRDSVDINATNSCLEVQIDDAAPVDNFIKLTEDQRRDRLRRIDAGEESAILKFIKTADRPTVGATPSRPVTPTSRPATGARPVNSVRPLSRPLGSPATAVKRPYSPSPAPGARPRYADPVAHHSKGDYKGGSYKGGKGPAPYAPAKGYFLDKGKGYYPEKGYKKGYGKW